ncbi:MAG: sigma-70 family RNA polymerase sigma factor [Phycisphaerae bacterium]
MAQHAANQAFDQAVRANLARLIGLARAMMGSGRAYDAKQPEDLVQDALLNLYRRRELYDWSDGGWALMARAVARNVVSCRRRRTGRTLEADEADQDIVAESLDPGSKMELAETTEVMRARIEALPENWRAALVLREQQEMAYKDIATTLAATEAQVKTWLHRARARLLEQCEDLL